MIISCPKCNSRNVRTINENNIVTYNKLFTSFINFDTDMIVDMLCCMDCGYKLNQDDCARLLLAELDSQS